MDEEYLKALFEETQSEYDLGGYDAFKNLLTTDKDFRGAFFRDAGKRLNLGTDINEFETTLGLKKKPSSKGVSIGYTDASQVPLASTSAGSKSEFTSSGEIPATTLDKIKQATGQLKKGTYDLLPAAKVIEKSFAKVPEIDRVKAYDKKTNEIISQLEPKVEQFNELAALIDAQQATPEQLEQAEQLRVSILQDQKKLQIMVGGYQTIEDVKKALNEEERQEIIERYKGPGGFFYEKADALGSGIFAIGGMVAGALPYAVRMASAANFPAANVNPVIEQIGMGELEESSKQLFDKHQQINRNIDSQYEQGIIDSFKSGDIATGANQATNKFLSSFLPSIAAASTGGAGVLGFAAQEYYGELANRDDLTEQQKLALATVKGSLELAFESLGTKAVADQVLNIMKEGGEELVTKTTKSFIEKALKDGFGKYTPLTAPVQEFISEYSTSLSQQLTDKLIDPEKSGLTFSEMNKQALEEGVVGAFGGEIMAAPTITMMFKSSKGKEMATAAQEKINQIDTELQKDLSDQTRVVLEDEKAATVQQINTAAEAEGEIINALPVETQQEINVLNQQIADLEESLPTLSEETRPFIENKIQELYGQVDELMTPEEPVDEAPVLQNNQRSGDIVGRTDTPDAGIPDSKGVEGIKDMLVKGGKVVLDEAGNVKEVKQNSGEPSSLFNDLSRIYGDKEKALKRYLEMKDDDGAFKKEHGDWENRIMKKFGRSGFEYSVSNTKTDKNEYAWPERDKDGKLIIRFNEDKFSRNIPFEQQKQDYIKTEIDPLIEKYRSLGDKSSASKMEEFKALFEKEVNQLRDIKLHAINSELNKRMSDSESNIPDELLESIQEVARLRQIELVKDYFGEPMIVMTGGSEGIIEQGGKLKKPGDEGYKRQDALTGDRGLYFNRNPKSMKEVYSQWDESKSAPGEGKDIYYAILKAKKPYYITDPQDQARVGGVNPQTIDKDIADDLFMKGYDAVIWDKTETGEDKHEIVVMEPEQVEIIGSFKKGMVSEEKDSDSENKTENEEKKNKDIQQSTKTDTGVPDGQKELPTEETESTGVELTPEEKSNLEGVASETGVNFREVQNVYNKYGEGKPLSEITAEDYQKAQEKREKSKIKETDQEDVPKRKTLKVAKRFLESEDISDDFKEALKREGTTYIPESLSLKKEEAKAYIDTFEENHALDEAMNNVTDLNNNMKGSVRGTIGAELFKRYMTLSNAAENTKDQVSNREKAAKVLAVAAVAFKNAGQEVNSAKAWKELISKTPEGAIGEITNKYKEQADKITEKDLGNIRDARKELLRLLETEEGKAEIGKRIEQEIGKISEKIFGKEQKQKIEDFFEKLIVKGNNKLFDATLALPVAVWNGAVNAVKNAVLFGASTANAVQAGIDYVNQNYKDPWREKEFKTMMTGGIKNLKLKKNPTEQTKNKILDAWENRLKKLKPESRKKLLADAINELTETGALSEQRFRDMYAEALGVPTLTEEDRANIYNLVTKINEADKDGENYKKLYDSGASKSELKQAKSKWQDSVRQARKANEELSDYFRNKKNIWETLSVILQGNLLTPISLITNVYSNALLQIPRFLSGGVASILDYTISQGAKYTFLSKKFSHERTVDIIARSKGSWKGVTPGIKEGWQSLIDGSTSEEISQRDLTRKLQPLKSAAQLWATYFGNNKLDAHQQLNAWAEATFGVPAEVFFRLLNLGDKPFRKLAETGQLYEIAALKGLKGQELAQFLEFPDEATLEEMKKAGDESTFQEENITQESINNLINRVKKIPVVGQFLAYAVIKTTLPFVKTPSNVIAEIFNYAVPPIPLARSMYEASKGNRRSSLGYFGDAAVGAMMGYLAYEIVANGLATGGAKEDEEKEQSIQYENVPPNSLNISALQRGLKGEGFKVNDDDIWVNYTKSGIPGAIIGMYATIGHDKTKEEIASMSIANIGAVSSQSLVKSALEQSFLAGVTSLGNALLQGGNKAERLMVNMSNTISSTFYPNTISAISKTSDDYIRSINDESVGKQIKNMFKTKMFMGENLPVKVTLWGDPVKNTPEGRSKFMYNLFDISKYKEVDTDNFGYKLYNEWNQSKNNEYLPSVPDSTITFKNKKVKLTPKQYESYLMAVGRARKELASFYVNSSNWEEDNEQERLNILQSLYSQGLENGRALFIESQPELFEEE